MRLQFFISHFPTSVISPPNRRHRFETLRIYIDKFELRHTVTSPSLVFLLLSCAKICTSAPHSQTPCHSKFSLYEPSFRHHTKQGKNYSYEFPCAFVQFFIERASQSLETQLRTQDQVLGHCLDAKSGQLLSFLRYSTFWQPHSALIKVLRVDQAIY